MTGKTAWEIFVELSEIVAEARPELAAEFRSLGTQSATTVAAFLNTHFPRRGGWYTVNIDQSPQLLREIVDAQK